MMTISPRDERAVRKLLEACLDQPKPSPELRETLNRCLRIWQHDLASSDTRAA